MSHVQEHDEALIYRLRAGDSAARNELASTYLRPIVCWLGNLHGRIDSDLRESAAEDAIMELLDRPEAYVPQRQTLEVYLRVLAARNLIDLLRRHIRTNRKCLTNIFSRNFVELGVGESKYLWNAEINPSILADAIETREKLHRRIQSLRKLFLGADLEFYELLISGVRETEVYALLLGVSGLSFPERVRAVKRAKDRVMRRLKRALRPPPFRIRFAFVQLIGLWSVSPYEKAPSPICSLG